VNSSIGYSYLVNLTVAFDLGVPTDLAVQVEDRFANVTLSMLGYSQNPMYVGSFRNKSFPAATLTPIDAMKPVTRLVFLLTIFSVIILRSSISSRGVDGDTSFSQIMVTTSNPELDQLCRDSTEGGSAITKEVKRARVRDEYGQRLKGGFEIVN
jgi:hypothetical protein